MGAHATAFLDFSRPRRGEQMTTWNNLPGFTCWGSTKDGIRYTHASLPGWEYRRTEIVPEMIPDLEVLAEKGVRPTEVTA